MTIYFYALQLLGLASRVLSQTPSNCKATPNSKDWPSASEWSKFNQSLSGQLLQPTPPGAVCHPDQPTYDPSSCPAVQAGWKSSAWHADNPVSAFEDNWNNDTCLPIPTAPCSGAGYPIYVVNATTAEDVKKGVDFTRRHNIRLIVKATGHDFLGRSSAPNSLSIWTHHIQGISFQNGFKPKGCGVSIDGSAITAAAGTQMLELDEQAHLRNLTIVSGAAGTVGVGGYLTGGGHGALTSTYGMGADQVLEMEIVTPGGEILTVNECQNPDLFWAVRGGGGSTFGVITSVTIRAFPSAPYLVSTVSFGTTPGTSAYWTAAAAFLSQFPALHSIGISGYIYVVTNSSSPELNITSPMDGAYGIFILPAISTSNTSASLNAAVTNAFNSSLGSFPPGQFSTSISPVQTYDDFWAWYKDRNDPIEAGGDEIIGSRLLDEKALTANLTALEDALRQSNLNSMTVHLVGPRASQLGPPRGGGNAVNPAWRNAVVHALLPVSWKPFDAAEKLKQENLMTNTYVEALRKLAPDTGAYVNEADVNEPNFQRAFWGDNYPRLLAIKKIVDPGDVLWCQPCVGNEGWKVVGDSLCRV